MVIKEQGSVRTGGMVRWQEKTTRKRGDTHYLYLGHEDVTATEGKVSRPRP